MPMPDYTIRSAPPLAAKKPGVGELAMDFAKSKALTAGLEAAFPGSGFAKEAGEAILPAFLAGGGAPLGGGQSKEGLMQARQLGALTQEEFLQAMKHAGYLEKGGEAKPWWKKAAEYAWGTGREGEKARKFMQESKHKDEGGEIKPWWAGTKAALEESKKKPRGEKLKKKKGTGYLDAASVVTSLFRETGGPIPGMSPGPLGMKDMLSAGKGKDVSKVKYKRTGGKASSEVEIGYHAPLAPKGD